VKVLITGIAGFAGGHLAQHLVSRTEHVVIGFSLPEPVDRFSGLFNGEPPMVYYADITNEERLGEILDHEQPDAVMHLAAHALVAGAWEQAAQIMENNAVATQILMQSLSERCPDARIMLVGSGDVYGHVNEEQLPLAESGRLSPNNPYSVSKLAQEYIALQYHAAFDTEVVVARPFNHIGPRQMGDFIVPVVAKQIAEIEAGIVDPVIKIGNLESKRDFLDVRDVVEAYLVILDRGVPGEVYNVCSGKARAIRDIVTTLVDLSTMDPELKQDPARMRPSDTPVSYGDNTKLISLGWKQELELRQSLEDVLDFWRGVVADELSAENNV
jgi:GDP-4-dehydro-6-deoxy-D-mannose reductase